MDLTKQYQEASRKTEDDLKTALLAAGAGRSARLSQEEVDAVVQRIARVMPAGQVPGVILNGLGRLKGRKLPREEVDRDVGMLFSGLGQGLENAAYLGLFAGPAAAIWAYQGLLKLAGISPNDAFPEGTWQFYVEYALREDTARHANETHGFDSVLNYHQVYLDSLERMTAWAMASIMALHQYGDILANEWRERVYTYLLQVITKDLDEADYYAGLYRQWLGLIPYSRTPDTPPDMDYPHYRQERFRRFLQQVTREMPEALYDRWLAEIEKVETAELSAYQQQMSILAYLEPGTYSEKRIPIPIEAASVGIIHNGQYYLIPACEPGTKEPAKVDTVINQIVAILRDLREQKGNSLAELARVRRSALPEIRRQFRKETNQALDAVCQAPILLNFDLRSPDQPLATLRQTERGIGSHALTVFDTSQTMVFDQSHVFYDGAWGSAFAEIMTNEALSWAVYLRNMPVDRFNPQMPKRVEVSFAPEEQKLISKAPKAINEAWAETESVNINAIMGLRKLFKRRSDLIKVTVNDLLLLYRAIHAATYQPSQELVNTLQQMAKKAETREVVVQIARNMEEARKVNPSLLIPIDASQRAPRERVQPLSFEVPLKDLELLSLHKETLEALDEYERGTGVREKSYTRFDTLQRKYLITLAGFGEVLNQAKKLAVQGESASVGTIKMLAHLPSAFQRMLDQYSQQFEWLNDIVKGREVFSNVGKVARNSSLVRFLTAKDDNEKKTLVWGILTDVQDVMRITLRDFRPHVQKLTDAGLQEAANMITQDYLDAYASGLNIYVAELHRITLSSRETKLSKSEREKL